MAGNVAATGANETMFGRETDVSRNGLLEWATAAPVDAG